MPALHVVTPDDVLERADAAASAAALAEAFGARLALHIRAPGAAAAALWELAAGLAPVTREHGALLLVNDRADVALAADACGVQLGARSIPTAAARTLRSDWVVGRSAHGADEAARAIDEGADFVLLGTIWPTPSHPGREGAGLEAVAEAAKRASPVVAIGGVTPERAGAVRAAGGHGVAAIRGVWEAADPVAAAGRYLEALGDGE